MRLNGGGETSIYDTEKPGRSKKRQGSARSTFSIFPIGKLHVSYRQAVASYEKETIVPVVHLSYIFHESFELTWPGSEFGAWIFYLLIFVTRDIPELVRSSRLPLAFLVCCILQKPLPPFALASRSDSQQIYFDRFYRKFLFINLPTIRPAQRPLSAVSFTLELVCRSLFAGCFGGYASYSNYILSLFEYFKQSSRSCFTPNERNIISPFKK